MRASKGAWTSLMEQCLADTGWPGLTVAIIGADGTELAAAVGFADREAAVAMAPRDRMLAGSVGKTFAAAAALRLVEEGRIALDEPIGRFADGLPWIDTLPQAEGITLRRLLAHRTGLADYIYTEGWRAHWAQSVAHDSNYAQTVEDGIRIAASEAP
ncbi:MAG TPA: serine hydrolase domain-containing protein, partial [Rhizomicrobium sp.]